MSYLFVEHCCEILSVVKVHRKVVVNWYGCNFMWKESLSNLAVNFIWFEAYWFTLMKNFVYYTSTNRFYNLSHKLNTLRLDCAKKVDLLCHILHLICHLYTVCHIFECFDFGYVNRILNLAVFRHHEKIQKLIQLNRRNFLIPMMDWQKMKQTFKTALTAGLVWIQMPCNFV